MFFLYLFVSFFLMGFFQWEGLGGGIPFLEKVGVLIFGYSISYPEDMIVLYFLLICFFFVVDFFFYFFFFLSLEVNKEVFFLILKIIFSIIFVFGFL